MTTVPTLCRNSKHLPYHRWNELEKNWSTKTRNNEAFNVLKEANMKNVLRICKQEKKGA
jgi:hypothetical protein